MNKKGFTLVELIAVIVIVGILSSVAVISVSSLMNRFRNDYYERLEKSVEAASREYVSDHTNIKYNGGSFTVSDLINNSYISDVKVYHKDKNCNGNITFDKINNTYKVCLNCDGEKYGSGDCN